MEFRQLEAFVATAELKSFSQAAKYLYLSQSTISSHVQNLEDDLGRKLLLRTTKSITLTPEGETFLSYARKIVETKDQAVLSLQQSSKSMLHIGASSIPSGYLLPKIIAGFKEKYPEKENLKEVEKLLKEISEKGASQTISDNNIDGRSKDAMFIKDMDAKIKQMKEDSLSL